MAGYFYCKICDASYTGNYHECPGAKLTEAQTKHMEHVHASGLTRSHKAPGFHQIPLEALQCLADRFDLGRAQRSPGTCWVDNKEKSLADDDFYQQTLNNAQEHLSKLMNGDFTEDNEWGHLGAIMWMCAVRAWRYKRREQKAD